MAVSSSMHKEDRRLWRRVLQLVRPFPLSSSKIKLLVAVSGGADSLALLHLLWQQLGAKRLMVAHLNHQLRPQADDDAKFVAETAASYGIVCKIENVNVAAVADTMRLSLEAAGRLARYRFLAAKAAEVGAGAVVVGHHADDQAETILLHLLRGSGGLRGMLPVGTVPERDDLPLIRPFLTTSRAEIEAYCTRHDLHPRQDASNLDVQFTRNRIRHELLPQLQTYNPQIKATLQQMAIITADEQAALKTQFDQIWPQLLAGHGEKWLSLNREHFVALAVAWQRLALRRAVQQLNPLASEISFQTIELARTLALEKQSGTEATLPGGLVLQVLAQELLFGNAAARPATVPQLDFEQSVQLPVPGNVDLVNGWTIAATPAKDVSLADIRQNENPWRAFVALANNDVLWLRPYAPDERFQPLGMGGQSQRIQDLLSDRKVARGKRPLWPVVAMVAHPAWIVGHHLDDRVRVTNNTLRVVQLTCFQRRG